MSPNGAAAAFAGTERGVIKAVIKCWTAILVEPTVALWKRKGCLTRRPLLISEEDWYENNNST